MEKSKVSGKRLWEVGGGENRWPPNQRFCPQKARKIARWSKHTGGNLTCERNQQTWGNDTPPGKTEEASNLKNWRGYAQDTSGSPRGKFKKGWGNLIP